LPILLCPHSASTDIYTLSLHDALPICEVDADRLLPALEWELLRRGTPARARVVDDDVHAAELLDSARDERVDLLLLGDVAAETEDRKSTRLNSSHDQISYAVFCLKKKK